MEAWLLVSLAEIGEGARRLMYTPSPTATNRVSQTAATSLAALSQSGEGF